MSGFSRFRPIQFCAATAAFAFFASAVFAPFHEVGWGVYLSPIIGLSLSALYICFALRKQWTWNWVFQFSIATVAINLLFYPSAEHFREHLAIARLIVGIEVLACALLLTLMIRNESKAEFFVDAK
jgi:hypothetical protein